VAVDQRYFDAKFEDVKHMLEALDKRVDAQHESNSRRIDGLHAVVSNHVDSKDAHGLSSAARARGEVIAWLAGLGTVGVWIVEITRKSK